MNDKAKNLPSEKTPDKPVRADAQRNSNALLEAAMAVFAISGVDAPVREIAEKAGVGVGTFYRHFPQRSDLIIAVFRNEVDACTEAAAVIAAEYQPGEALEHWLQRFVDFISAKRGLSAALHSGDPAFEPLPNYFLERLCPALQGLLDAAVAGGQIRPGIDPPELLYAIGRLCATDGHGGVTDQARRMVSLLIDGLRYGASAPSSQSRV